MSIFRDKRTYPTGERDIASPPSSGVSHIADLVAQVAARNAAELSAASPVHVSSGSSGKLISPVRSAARQRAVKLIRQAVCSISLGELACVVDAQPQHVSLALSESAPSKPFAAENFVLIAERRPELVSGVVQSFVSMVDADRVESIGRDLIRLAHEMRSRGSEVGQ